jgi:hypothetical protein
MLWRQNSKQNLFGRQSETFGRSYKVVTRLALIQTVIALGLQLTAFLIWVRLFGRIRPWNWWLCAFGIILVMTHRVAELAGYHSYGHFSSVPIAVVFVVATYMAKRAVDVDEKRQALLKLLEQQRHELETQVEQQRGTATALAIILNDFKSRIEYYEKLADEHQLPRYDQPPLSEFPDI